MSSTNRGAVRKPQDFYETPEWLTEAIMPSLHRWFGYSCRRILEPASGNGAIVRVLERWFPEARIDAGDIQNGQDFLTHEYSGSYDLIITNPPYSLAMEFVERAYTYHNSVPHGLLSMNRGLVAMLLRLNFLGSQERAPWFRLFGGHTPSIYVSPRRPDFTGDGGDSTEYAWFVWGRSKSEVFILDTDLKDSKTLNLLQPAPVDKQKPPTRTSTA
jgi:hypothetical protein